MTICKNFQSLTEGSRRILKKIGPAVSEEKLFKGVDGQTMDGRRTKSDHNSSSSAFDSGELNVNFLLSADLAV